MVFTFVVIVLKYFRGYNLIVNFLLSIFKPTSNVSNYLKTQGPNG